MSLGQWISLGAFAGIVCGGMIGVVSVLVHYNYPHNHHYDFYPMPIAVGNVSIATGMMGIIPGAIIGGIVGAKIRAAQARRYQQAIQEIETSPEAWPPPPKPLRPDEL